MDPKKALLQIDEALAYRYPGAAGAAVPMVNKRLRLCIQNVAPEKSSYLELVAQTRSMRPDEALHALQKTLSALRAEYAEQLKGGRSEENQQEDYVSEGSIQVFVSHVAEDESLANALVRSIEGCFEVPGGAIRCTSVTGYKLSPGDDATTQLRSDLRQSQIVIGLMSPLSLRSGWVLMELGAAWGLGRRTCPVLMGQIDFENIPGPLKGRRAIRLTLAEDVADLMDVVKQATGWKPRPGAQAHTAVDDLVAAALKVEEDTASQGQTLGDSSSTARVTDETDATISLRGWIKDNEQAMKRGVSLSALDRELALASGLASKLMKAAADAEGWDETQRGSDSALYLERPITMAGGFGLNRPPPRGWR